MQIWYTCRHNTSNKSIIFIRISLFPFDIFGYRQEIHFLLREIFACVWKLHAVTFACDPLAQRTSNEIARCETKCCAVCVSIACECFGRMGKDWSINNTRTIPHGVPFQIYFGNGVTLFRFNKCIAEKERRKNRIYKLTMALTELKKTYFIAFPMWTAIGFHVKHMNPFRWEVNPRQCVHDERWSDTHIHEQGQGPRREKLWSIGCLLWMNACVSNWIDD